MSSIHEPHTATYDAVPHRKAARASMIFVGLLQTQAAQNSTANLVLPEAFLSDDQEHSVNTVKWFEQAIAFRSRKRTISLLEAQHFAIQALCEAEARRQAERQREAAFWASLDEE